MLESKLPEGEQLDNTQEYKEIFKISVCDPERKVLVLVVLSNPGLLHCEWILYNLSGTREAQWEILTQWTKISVVLFLVGLSPFPICFTPHYFTLEGFLKNGPLQC